MSFSQIRDMICPFLTGTSAAQNVPVIRICQKCGALLMDKTEGCSFCEEPVENSRLLQPVVAREAQHDDSEEPEWRQEVGRRLALYRARRDGVRPVAQHEAVVALPPRPKARRLVATDPDAVVDTYFHIEPGAPVRAVVEPAIRREARATSATLEQPESPAQQKGLPFREVQNRMQQLAASERERDRARPRTLARLRPSERMEICIQPELDFSPAPGERARPQTALVPVATLAERRNAGFLDAIFILITCATFAGLFVGLMRALGSEFIIDRMDAVICAPVLFLFYALYFLVFTVFAGATPGMQLSGLTIVRLDGRLPDTSQLLWRGIGYVLSGATLMLGFLWAFWDEDGFTWHDRVSQTYLTSSAPVADPDPIEFHGTRRPVARR
jgi:uncharacterized RDD family membrane protein YckC